MGSPDGLLGARSASPSESVKKRSPRKLARKRAALLSKSLRAQ